MEEIKTNHFNSSTATDKVAGPLDLTEAVLRASKENPKECYTTCVNNYSEPTSTACEQIKYWEDGYKFYNYKPLDADAYTRKINEQLEELVENDPGLLTDRFYCNGTVDLDTAKEYLRILNLFPDKQRTATQLIFNICWLCERRDELADIVATQFSEPEDEDTTMLRKQFDTLNINADTKNLYTILYALKDAWHEREKTWAIDNAKFANKIASILNRKKDAIKKGLNRACANIREEKSSTKCYPLSTLTERQVDIKNPTEKREEWEMWRTLYTKIQKIMPGDTTGDMPGT